jgi:hypothetical protein
VLLIRKSAIKDGKTIAHKDKEKIYAKAFCTEKKAINKCYSIG